MAGGMQLGERTGFQRVQFLLIDQMVADQPVARAIAKLDIEREGFEQFVTLERGEEIGARAMPLIELVETGHDALEIWRWQAVFVECAKSLLARLRDARMLEVDMNFGAACALRPPDKEWLDGQCKRPIARVPPALLEEQILAILEPEQGQCREAATVEVAAEQDREFVLHAPEFARDGQAGHDLVAELGRGAGPDAQVAMRIAVEGDVIRHPWTAFSGFRTGEAALSRVRLGGSAV